MQKNLCYFKKSHRLLFTLITTFGFLLCISSCKDTGKKAAVTDKPLVGCSIDLNPSDIQDNWVNKDYTKPGDKNEIDSIDVISFYNPLSKVFTVTVLGLRKDNTEIIGSEIKIFDGTVCTPPRYTSIPSHNYFKIKDLDILDAGGKLKKFNKVSFSPQQYSGNKSFMNFSLNVDLGGTTMLLKGETLPCPPCINCKPPCPEGCEPACTKEDSLKLMSPASMEPSDTTKIK